MEASGHARSTVGPRLELLEREGLLEAVGGAASTGGRIPKAFALNTKAHGLVVVDVGPSHVNIAVTTLGGDIIGERDSSLEIAADPEQMFGAIADEIQALLDQLTTPPIVGMAVGLPAPVDNKTSRPLHPPFTPRWHNYDIAGRLQKVLQVPVSVDRNNNLMALGELTLNPRENSNMLYISVSTWIGAGVVIDGKLVRGSTGHVGHLGHVVGGWEERTRCICGNSGCLEAVAGGRALLERFGPTNRRQYHP
jgi:predicted NBD/HSP70 family sugar kinase